MARSVAAETPPTDTPSASSATPRPAVTTNPTWTSVRAIAEALGITLVAARARALNGGFGGRSLSGRTAHAIGGYPRSRVSPGATASMALKIFQSPGTPLSS
jgi:hypothetical protein